MQLRVDRKSTLGNKSVLKKVEELAENQLTDLDVEIERSIESTLDISPNSESATTSSIANNATSSLTLMNTDVEPNDKK